MSYDSPVELESAKNLCNSHGRGRSRVFSSLTVVFLRNRENTFYQEEGMDAQETAYNIQTCS